MRFTVLIIALLLSININAQPVNYNDWQEESKKDNRLLPRYGGPRNKAQQTDDELYIKTATEEMHANPHDGSDQLVALGFKYLAQGDPRVAMYRFNQAWILDSVNANVYSGFGSVYFMFQDYNKSLDFFAIGLTLDPKNTNLLTYKARTYLAMFETATDITAINKALPLLNTSYHIDPRNPYTTYMLSRFYALNNNCDSAFKYYNECMTAGGQPITEKFTRALKARCNVMDK